MNRIEEKDRFWNSPSDFQKFMANLVAGLILAVAQLVHTVFRTVFNILVSIT